MKKGIKLYLFITPPPPPPGTVMVNKEMMSEEQMCMSYHITIITPIKTCIKMSKFTFIYNCHFVKNYLFKIKLL